MRIRVLRGLLFVKYTLRYTLYIFRREIKSACKNILEYFLHHFSSVGHIVHHLMAVYSVGYIGQPITETDNQHITVQRRNEYMSFYAAQVGEVIIKPQYRQDFGRFFYEEYENIEDKALLGFVEDWVTDRNDFFIPLYRWQHSNARPEWQDKYSTSYNAQTGRFIYGVCYSLKSKRLAMSDFFELLQEMSEEVIFTDYIDDFMIDSEEYFHDRKRV